MLCRLKLLSYMAVLAATASLSLPARAMDQVGAAQASMPSGGEHELAAYEHANAVLSQRIYEMESTLAALNARIDEVSLDSSSGAYSNCETCGDCCCCCGWYGTAEAIWMRPFIEGNQAFEVFSNDPSVPNASIPFDYDYEITPRVRLGYNFCTGWGVRGDYWVYEHDAIPQSITEPAAFNVQPSISTPVLGFAFGVATGNTLTTTHSLELQTYGVEFTRRIDVCSCHGVFAVGVRYGRMEQVYTAVETDPGGASLDALFGTHSFEGIGPSVAYDVQIPLGCSCLVVYGQARGSILLGDMEQRVDRDTGNVYLRDADEVLPLGELQIGLQYNSGMWFARAGWEGQIWHNGGGPNETNLDLGLGGFVAAIGMQR